VNSPNNLMRSSC